MLALNYSMLSRPGENERSYECCSTFELHKSRGLSRPSPFSRGGFPLSKCLINIYSKQDIIDIRRQIEVRQQE